MAKRTTGQINEVLKQTYFELRVNGYQPSMALLVTAKHHGQSIGRVTKVVEMHRDELETGLKASWTLRETAIANRSVL